MGVEFTRFEMSLIMFESITNVITDNQILSSSW